jgi:hypothetical protein
MLSAPASLVVAQRMDPEPVIPDRGEFVDVLAALRRGHVLVRLSEQHDGCWIAGRNVFWSFEPLVAYGLIEEFRNPDGFAGVRYFRLNAHGEAFAARACAAWKRRPLLERFVARLTG